MLGTASHALTATELPLPERSTLIAACIVIAQEYASLDTRCFDLLPPAAGSAAEQWLCLLYTSRCV